MADFLSVSVPRVHRDRRLVRDHGLFRRPHPVDHHGRDLRRGLDDLNADDPDRDLQLRAQPVHHG